MRKYMKEKRVNIDEAQDQRTWRLKTRCPTPNMEMTEEEEVLAMWNLHLFDSHLINCQPDQRLCEKIDGVIPLSNA